MNELRVDKWLWSVRIFKTRSIAANACKNNRIRIGERILKPSSLVAIGDVISVRKPPVTFSFKVLGIPPSRVGAKLVEQYLENRTPPEELQQIEMQRFTLAQGRPKGAGRPTKKERRDLDHFFAPNWMDLGDEEDTECEYDIEDEQELLDSMGFWDE